MRIIFIDESINANTFIGGIYLNLEDINLIIDCIDSSWKEIGKEWKFHYIIDKKYNVNGKPISEIFLKNIIKYIPTRNTIVVMHKGNVLIKCNDLYPIVVFNLYSFPIFLSRSDFALIDPNPQVKLTDPIIKRINYPKIFHNEDELINKLDKNTKSSIIKIIRENIRKAQSKRVSTILNRELQLKPDIAIKTILKWSLMIADYVVSSSDSKDSTWNIVDPYGCQLK
ncbi:hypothetical protein [Acidianus brierleyi]|uniref:Uncharacterized protein n=1 Tax=Acidianus brierleyi TaxID=41673 RepID=A0A2U9ICD2_9CREN|nr:hypothetical protein [Acidianus brierleyi]AWR93685.1 hypothetical protein DFR85_02690 [Acidianus brierleyi]